MNTNQTSGQSQLTRASRLGVSGPRAFGLPVITAPIAASGHGPSLALNSPVVAHAIPRDRHEAAFAAKPEPSAAAATQLGQANIDNYMTRAYATGKGASGPPPEPPKRKPV